VDVWSERLGVRGRCDVVEVHDDGRLVPVEYKMGVRHGIAADLQVCGQALCLEEMLDVRIDEAAIWYGQPRRRHTVGLDDALRAATEQAVLDIRRAMSDRHLPAAPDDARCTECQLLTHCAPSIVADPDRVLRYMHEQVMMCD
jgi:CRISPR-associated exonuclease Cas4